MNLQKPSNAKKKKTYALRNVIETIKTKKNVLKGSTEFSLQTRITTKPHRISF